MAESLIQLSRNQSSDETGGNYFNELVSRLYIFGKALHNTNTSF